MVEWDEIIVRALKLGLVILSEVVRYAPPPRVEARLEGGLAHSLHREQADRPNLPPSREVAGGHHLPHPVGELTGAPTEQDHGEDDSLQPPPPHQGEEGKEEEVEEEKECPLCKRFGPICDSLGERSASCWALVSLLADGLLTPDEFSEKLMVLLREEGKLEEAKMILEGGGVEQPSSDSGAG